MSKNKNYKILLVDDEDSILNVSTEIIKHLGYSVITASNGKDAIKIYENNNDIDLIILDYNMPGMNGSKCFSELLKINSDTKVIISSGFNDQKDMDEIIVSGTVDFLSKPYRINELNEKIKKALRN